jgi:8-oxo-dGTP pyrophosphatase MutT (NUDIX family)
MESAEPSTETYRRRSARVVLLDGAGRILLFRLRDATNAEHGHCWITPGGGVQDGESLREAAARELHEETGLRLAPEQLGPRIAETSGYADLGWAAGVFRDDFFFHRVDHHDVDTRGFEDLERSYITGHRWWPHEELETTNETVYPFALAPLVRELSAGRSPAEPVRLPWHH